MLCQQVSLLGRLQKLFQNSFPLNASVATSAVQEVTSLKNLLEPPAGAAQLEGEEDSRWSCEACVRGVWTQLQDVNEAVGLRYQWGGSHCNKALLCCLGIDTRNIVSLQSMKETVCSAGLTLDTMVPLVMTEESIPLMTQIVSQ